MSKRTKLEKFAQNQEFKHVFENYSFEDPTLYIRPGESIDNKGKWNQNIFNNTNPLVLELACGRAEYSLAMSQTYSDENFIAIDIKGARIWKGAKASIALGLQNIAFVRSRIELIHHFFGPEEVDEVWITFPDPFLRESKSNRRLTSKFYLNIYKQIIKPNAILHLKTDDDTLFAFTMETLRQDPGVKILYHNDDIYANPLAYPELNIKTYYEAMHLKKNKTIKYVRWSMDIYK